MNEKKTQTPPNLEPVLEGILQSHHTHSSETNRILEHTAEMNVEQGARVEKKLGEIADAISGKRDTIVEKTVILNLEETNKLLAALMEEQKKPCEIKLTLTLE